ncbi:MAG TPA: hypothetical protein VNZ45_18955 [Bacteroidia bacterium]|jgi:hypothetical protein|nr:hypothetical protein [Bacteroidia bacterium]
MNITPNTNQQIGLDFIINQVNITAKSIFDAAESAKLAANPQYVVQTYVPIVDTDYLTARVNDLLNSYYQQYIAARQADPTNAAILQAVLALPVDKFNTVVTTVEGLLNQ